MDYTDVRKKFIEFFVAQQHQLVPSAPLIPEHDASVLFTTAGMQQFKPYYTGVPSPYGDRVVSVQKCFRTSDIDEVGDATHLTFFEMLGNFAFNGQVSKQQAILWGWEFLTSPAWLNVAPDRIMASYYNGNRSGTFSDDEAKTVLQSLTDVGLTQIVAQPDTDNFWGPTGSEGPCGPTVEFYIDGVEVWNIVFNQFYCESNGALRPAAGGIGIDTGMGLERLIVALTPEAYTVYDIDALQFIVDKIHDHTPEIDIGSDRSVRIIADHLRASVFLLADHIQPSNKEQGYLLRRLLRRAILHLDKLEALAGFAEIITAITSWYGEFYPGLIREERNILQLAELERDKFLKTITQGRHELDKLIAGAGTIAGTAAFDLYATFGIPIDVIKEEMLKAGKQLDEKQFEADFETAFKQHQDVSRTGVEQKFGGHGLSSGAAVSADDKQIITRYHTATHLLHAALRQFLGIDVKQAGSDLNTERLRFDFTFSRPLTDTEKQQIGEWVNNKIAEQLPVHQETKPLAEALAEGAVAFFREKYPDPVNVYTIYNKDDNEVVSKELCGGPHVGNTGEIGKFKIIKEQSSSAGIRRIRAVIE
ncbi:TPA: alanine--tRNA ligase [Patescibacteria group bacterium]|uniref:alanine--tRNA ligase n=1 Tax=candidate division Kazan bacterium GW2011_GWA1_44_22 TaxID=1620410 RepID=A0A0G1I0P5_UNCK3|nr:MAG: Alanine-tRNA ligase [candidate division Kazan bacterium GW2011_GWA1_44_22]HCR42322.1 alanine--tRNA ligase [Patescibacteria group bacterium]